MAAAAGVVDVWVAPLEVEPSVLATLAASLSPAERGRAGRYRDAATARQFSASRGWLRHTLGAALGVPAADVALPSGPGKPHAGNGSGPCFNVSHAGGVALIAVAAHEVGVDVEPHERAPSALDAIDVACSGRERAALRRLPPDERGIAFLEMWTAKEAYLKATGLGLSAPPAEVEVARAGAPGPVVATVAGAATGWWVRRLEPAPGYVGAVAAEGRAWSVRLRPAAGLVD